MFVTQFWIYVMHPIFTIKLSTYTYETAEPNLAKYTSFFSISIIYLLTNTSVYWILFSFWYNHNCIYNLNACVPLACMVSFFENVQWRYIRLHYFFEVWFELKYTKFFLLFFVLLKFVLKLHKYLRIIYKCKKVTHMFVTQFWICAIHLIFIFLEGITPI